MTCILTIELCQKHRVDIHNQEVAIGVFETKIEGTSAELEAGQIYMVEQLLYGLMLPSGNDASIALAIFCG
jgi:serine-type D-Ala-D-Ala carboxypeptidase (penicillin-binding protein 5/6)